MIAFLVLLAVVVVGSALATRYGVDSRDASGALRRSHSLPGDLVSAARFVRGEVRG